mgnify:CR=1 FL=1
MTKKIITLNIIKTKRFSYRIIEHVTCMYTMNIRYDVEYIDIKEMNMLVNVLIPINNATLFFTMISWQLHGIYYKLWYY